MKKIMFNDKYGLTQAVLKGRKTMTRRVAKQLNDPRINHISKRGTDERVYFTTIYNTGRSEDVYPLYQIGEVVAVAQRYSECAGIDDFYNCKQAKGQPGWNDKMFVNAYLMPHRIRITDIKLERLQDISEEDAMREGVFKYDKPPLHHEADMFAPWAPYVRPYKWDSDNLIYRCTASYAFAYLIDKISGKGTWNRNPWVFVYGFELIK